MGTSKVLKFIAKVKKMENDLAVASAIIAGLVLVIAVGWWKRRKAASAAGTPTPGSPSDKPDLR